MPTEARQFVQMILRYWFSIYLLSCSNVIQTECRLKATLCTSSNPLPRGVQTRSLLSVPAPTLPPLCCGREDEGHFHSHPHLKSLRSHCHHYTEVASLCMCLQSKSGKTERHRVSQAKFSLFFLSYQTHFNDRGEGPHLYLNFLYRLYRWPFSQPLFMLGSMSVWKHISLLFAHEGTSKPTLGNGRITCMASKVIFTVILGVIAGLRGHALTSISYSVHALLPVKLSKVLNAPWAKLPRNSWKC